MVLNHPSPTLRKNTIQLPKGILNTRWPGRSPTHRFREKHNYKKLQWRPKENENEWTYSKKGKRTGRKEHSGLESFME